MKRSSQYLSLVALMVMGAMGSAQAYPNVIPADPNKNANSSTMTNSLISFKSGGTRGNTGTNDQIGTVHECPKGQSWQRELYWVANFTSTKFQCQLNFIPIVHGVIDGSNNGESNTDTGIARCHSVLFANGKHVC